MTVRNCGNDVRAVLAVAGVMVLTAAGAAWAQTAPAAPSQAIAAPPAAESALAAVKNITAAATPAAPEIRAQLSPRHVTTLSSEIPAKVERMPLREGERFKQGEVLVVFDCSSHRAQLEKARAIQAAADKTYVANKRLLELKSIGALEYDLSQAEVSKAKADVSVMSTTVSKCTISAPFSGRVAEVKGREHQFAQAGEPLMEILDDRSLEVEFIVPSQWLTWLKPGLPFAIQVSETGKDYPAKITRLGARVDPVSQSIKVAGEIAGRFDDLTPGMSGRIQITPPK